ncbi:putative pentatricopeptide repeat-containing protein At1g19290 [Diospyros lotus]|uniref:putative pentatricopeptide repeat-containing protein At1g19290 n=1 Tax=Diospyros lotus TaxID=55363 RepID=UPI00225059C7|nr:putative pentatricopeptide repeat-containing protein At1g19290 [Diospyros lotus]
MSKATASKSKQATLSFLFLRIESIHTSPTLRWKPRDEYKMTRPELLDRICRLLVLRRFNAISYLSFDFSDDLVDAVLRKLRLNPDACFEFFKLACRQQKYRPNIKVYCKIVHILSRGRMFDQTRTYLYELVGFCQNKNAGSVIWDELVRVYREFSFSGTVFDMILKAYAKKGLTKNALYVFDNMGKCGRVPSLQSCNSLLSSLVRNGELHSVFCVYDQMIRVGIVPDVYTCTIMVDAYCKDGRLGKANELLNEMKDLGFEPNVVTYHCLINGYIKLGDVKGVEGVVELMNQRGILINSVTYTLLIKIYCKLCKLDKAERVLQSMKQMSSLMVDEHAYGVLIDGYCRNGRMGDALRIKDEMMGLGLSMNLVICNSMINGYCKLGRVHEAEELVTSMFRWKLKPDSYTYNTLLDGYCRKGDTTEAFNIYDKMLEECIKPTVLTYNTLLIGLFRKGAFDDALNLWQLMLERGVIPNEVSYGIILDMLFKIENFEAALVLWKHALARGFATRVTFNTMVNGLFKMGKMVEAEEVLHKMEEMGFS